METVVIILIVVLSLGALLYAYYILVKAEQNFERQRIYGARERIENKMFQAAELINADPSIFFDSTQLLLSHRKDGIKLDVKSVRNDSFFRDLGFENIEQMQTQANCVALLMSFNKRYDNRQTIIKQACADNGFECHRSDDEYQSGNLLKQIVNLILQSQLIIALLDGKNPNVFYEIGIAHSLGKPVILIANMEEESDLPFNISTERLLLYKNMDDLASKLSNTLRNIRNAEHRPTEGDTF